MGKRGPKPKPKRLNVLEGNPSRKPMLPDDLDVSPDMPAIMPDVVAMDPIASAEWGRLLHAMPDRLYTAADVAMLTVYVQSWSLLIGAQREIDENGLTILEISEKETDKGGYSKSEKRVANPAVKLWKTATENLIKVGDRLGLNPGVRARMGVPDRGASPEQQKSPWAGLITQ